MGEQDLAILRGASLRHAVMSSISSQRRAKLARIRIHTRHNFESLLITTITMQVQAMQASVPSLLHKWLNFRLCWWLPWPLQCSSAARRKRLRRLAAGLAKIRYNVLCSSDRLNE